MQRIRAGYADVVSPFGGGLRRVSLRPEEIICVLFWTRDARPMIPMMEELRNSGICLSFLYTINNYPRFMEPRTPEKSLSIEVLHEIRNKYPEVGLRWRYDTIVLTEELDLKWHLNNFNSLCREVSPLVDECIFSFCDYYKKTLRNMNLRVKGFRIPGEEEKLEISKKLAQVSRQNNIKLISCADGACVGGRVGRARCVDPGHFMGLMDTREKALALQGLKVKPTRQGCGCYESVDIGAYDTCGHGCVYCYANSDPDKALENIRNMKADKPSLDPRR